jgi:hypothetical protein
VNQKRGDILFNLVDKYLMRPKRLREAIQAVVNENNELLSMLAEYEKDETPTNLTWSEGDTWYGWTYNPEKKRYYFDDIGNISLMGLWEDQWLREADEYPEEKINKWASEQIRASKLSGEVPF